MGYEQYKIFQVETALSIGLACAMVFVVTLLFLFSVKLAALVLVIIALIDINLLGMLSLWGEHLNAVTIVNVVMSIGIAVDYAAHMVHAYQHAGGTGKH